MLSRALQRTALAQVEWSSRATSQWSSGSWARMQEMMSGLSMQWHTNPETGSVRPHEQLAPILK